MKNKTLLLMIAALCLPMAIFGQGSKKNRPVTLFVEAEQFQFPGDWTYSNFDLKEVLQGTQAKYPASSVLEIPQDGTYHIWVRTYDNLELLTKSRSFTMEVNGELMPEHGGTHGKLTGLEWQKLGEVKLQTGDAYFVATPTRKNITGIRFDAMIVTTDAALNPVGKFTRNAERAPLTVNPKRADCVFENAFTKLEAPAPASGAKVHSIKNKSIEISFTQMKDSAGKSFYARSFKAFKNGAQYAAPILNDEFVFLTHSQEIRESGEHEFALWNSASFTPKVRAGEKLFDLQAPPFNPYEIGESKILRIVGVEKGDAPNSLKLDFGGGIKGLISLVDDTPIAKFEISCKIEEDGFYSFGMAGFYPVEKEAMNQAFLPPMFQMRRLMGVPKLIGNGMTSQPMVMIESGQTDEKFALALIADPANLPYGEWSKMGNSVYGFSMKSPRNLVQPAIFQPILGGRGSGKSAGDTLEASWYMLAQKGGWTEALELANSKIFAASKLREPYTASLSDAACNIAKFLADEDVSGWSAHLKGRWNIEFQYAATQSNPLAELSRAILTQDEEYYKNIALPSVEYTLSRRGFHFSSKPGEGRSTAEGITALGTPSYSFWGDYYAGLNTLLGGGNAWAKNFYNRYPGNFKFSDAPAWAVDLGIYIADPTEERLQKTLKGADKWITQEYGGRDYGEVDFKGFVNVSFYPYWWYLVDLYEITGEKRYLEKAQEGAFYTLSCLWNYPTPPEGDVTINPGGFIEGTGRKWWKGDEAYRLGYDESRAAVEEFAQGKNLNRVYQRCLYMLPEHKAPGMAASRIGLGIEQPITYMVKFQNFKNIIMPGWAPEMLKVFQHTKKDIIRKFARHSIVGRYANFPGYYVKDFTDVMHDAQYPYKGPDVTAMYFHHAPCQFAHTVDYLMAQIEQRTNNLVRFPHVRQQGYVWFTDRIFGLPGKVFGEDGARPLLPMDAVKTGTPLVSVMAARAPEALWIFLLNDSSKKISAAPLFDESQKLLDGVKLGEKSVLYSASGRELGRVSARGSVEIPPLGLVALKIPAQKAQTSYANPTLPEDSHITRKNFPGKSWRALHAFRIRGPFGKDSLFAYFDCRYETRAKITLHMGGKDYVCERFPYEFSAYPLPRDIDISFSFTVEEEGMEPFKTEIFTLHK